MVAVQKEGQISLFPDLETDVPPVDMQRLYLVDAMALAYRAHYVFISRPLVNSKGQNTSAAYGFTTSLLKLIEDHGMDYMAVIFDAPGEEGTFREALYEAYKAHREPPPEDLQANLPWIKEIVRALDIPVIEEPGVEADDVIGTLARRAEAHGIDVVIVSPDKDFLQLLSPHISIYKPARRGEAFDWITVDTFRQTYKLEPHQFIDVLALMGDPSDNVPGVPGIGEKTALQLIQQYGSVENLLAHAEEVPGKRAREGLLAHREAALLSKELVTIRTDVPLQVSWQTFHRAQPDAARLMRIFQELEFESLLRRLREEGLGGSSVFEAAEIPQPQSETEPDISFDFGPYQPLAAYDPEKADYRIVRNLAELEALLPQLEGRPRLSLDTETTSTEAMWASLVGLAISWEKGQGVYVPTPLPDGTPTEIVLQRLAPYVQSAPLKVGQNLKYDLLVLARHGLELGPPYFDTMVAHYLIAPEEPHSLDVLARQYLHYQTVPIVDLIGAGKEQKSMRDVAIDTVGPYACEDTDIALQLADVLAQELDRLGLRRIAETMEFPLIEVLADMERTGIGIDRGVLREIGAQLEEELHRLEAEIYRLAGITFTIGSPQQLAEVLFKRLGLKPRVRTGTGRPSTKESVLEELATQHPLPGLVLDWRHLAKLKSTYVDSLEPLVHPETGRIHTTFNQTITATGRLSSSNPNLQNIPVRTEVGREIRRAFVPRPGWKLLSADYVQIELRILAAMSGDEALRRAFAEGQDIHAATAARVFNVPLEQVTPEQRRRAKMVNYGIPYGISPWGLAQRLRCPTREAQALIEEYQRAFPGVTRFLHRTVEEARQRGYVETLLGRRRYVPKINSPNRAERSMAERIAVNMPIQGTQADMIKLAMVHIYHRLRREGRQAKMILQVHDELVFEVPPEELEPVRQLVEEEMKQALPLEGVPIEVDIGFGDNWLDAH